MPLSSNTLIHFTDSKDKLKKILEDNFRIFYCKETIVLDGKRSVYYAPMVSFCDIPLSEVKDHVSKYGRYGLGMTKEWGMRKGLNPVLYIAQHSSLSASYRKAFNHFNKRKSEDPDWSNEQKALADVLRYIKNYEADLIRRGKKTPNYRFSDEREWRYVQPYSGECDMVLVGPKFEKPENRTASEAKLVDFRLVFEPNDIKYIIINDDSEIGEFIDHLRRVKGKNFTLHDIERLNTRILTTEQIKGDM